MGEEDCKENAVGCPRPEDCCTIGCYCDGGGDHLGTGEIDGANERNLASDIGPPYWRSKIIN